MLAKGKRRHPCCFDRSGIRQEPPVSGRGRSQASPEHLNQAAPSRDPKVAPTFAAPMQDRPGAYATHHRLLCRRQFRKEPLKSVTPSHSPRLRRRSNSQARFRSGCTFAAPHSSPDPEPFSIGPLEFWNGVPTPPPPSACACLNNARRLQQQQFPAAPPPSPSARLPGIGAEQHLRHLLPS